MELEGFLRVEIQGGGIVVATEFSVYVLFRGIEKQENTFALVDQAVVDFGDLPFAIQRHHFDQSEQDFPIGIHEVQNRMRQGVVAQDGELAGLPETVQYFVFGLDFRATHARGGGRAEFQCFFPGFECEFAVDIVAGGKTVHFLGKAIEVDEAKIILCRYVLSLYLAYLPAAVYRFCDDSFLFSGLQRGGQAE